MPTYEYQCPEGHRFEVFQKMSDEPAASCPTCGAPAQRLISGGAGFLFRGDGFYITDYRSEDYKKKASKEAGGGSGDSGGGKGGDAGAPAGSGGSSGAGASRGSGGEGGGSGKGSSGGKGASGTGGGSKPASES